MQIQAINSFNSVNFSAGKQHLPKNEDVVQPNYKQIKKLAGPAIAAMFLIPCTTSCYRGEDIYVSANADAKATLTIPVTPGSTDTIHKTDTIYVPVEKEFNFPYEIEDSLNRWRRDLKIPADGDDGIPVNKAVLYISGINDWEYNRPEYAVMNIQKSDSTQAHYDRVINNKTRNDVKITKVKPGDLTVIRKNGTQTDNISGLLFDEEGTKTFAHSVNDDKIIVYKKNDDDKYVETSSIEPGYLSVEEVGNNVLLNGVVAPDFETHYTHLQSGIMDIDDIKKNAGNVIIIEKK